MRKAQSGVVAIEMALLTVPLCLMAFGAAEYGRAIYQYNALVKSTRDAVRYLSSRGPGVNIDEAKCMAVTGTDDCTGAVLAPGLTVAMVDTCDRLSCPGTHQAVPTGSGTIDLVTVYIGRAAPYNFQALVPLVASDFAFGVISATMRQ